MRGTSHTLPDAVVSTVNTSKQAQVTFGPSLIRIAGISSLSIAWVFHQLGAPSNAIFSSVDNFFSRSGTDASRNERGMAAMSGALARYERPDALRKSARLMYSRRALWYGSCEIFTRVISEMRGNLGLRHISLAFVLYANGRSYLHRLQAKLCLKMFWDIASPCEPFARGAE